LKNSRIFTIIKSIATSIKSKSSKDILKKRIKLSTDLNLNMKIWSIDSKKSFLKEPLKRILMSRFLVGFLTLLQLKMYSMSF
jgi:hypothetical protein